MRPARVFVVLFVVLPLAASTLGAAPMVEPPGAATAERRVAAPVSFDFDDGMQGWTIETADRSPSTWERSLDTDGFDRLHPAPAPDTVDHHLTVDEYRKGSDTRLVSPNLQGDGSPVVLTFEERHWTVDNFDFLHVEWRAGQDGAWQRLDSCHGRGRYPAWNTVTNTFTPDGSFQVAFWFTADELNADSSVREPHQFGVYERRYGLGAWVDDVELTGGEAEVAPCMYGESGETAGGDDSQRRRDTEATESGAPHVLAPEHAPQPEPSTGTGIGGHDVLVDRTAHPEYQAMTTAATEMRLNRAQMDPYRWDWDGNRGRMREVWVVNRYDTPLAATMYAPMDDGRYPAIVFIGGLGMSDFSGYASLLQRLAEEGYVVLSVSPQGWEGLGERTSPIKPARRFCGDFSETQDEWWRQPQEAGLTETEYCAGEIGVLGSELTGVGYECAGGVQYPGCHLVDMQTGNGDRYAEHFDEALYQHGVGPTWTFGALDAVDWLTSVANPWRHLIDRQRIGTVGHSAGGFAAMVAANAHPDVSASVALDQYGRWPEGLAELRAPTLLIAAENGRNPGNPTAARPDPVDGLHLNQQDVARALRDAGVDTGWITLTESLHQDFAYFPYATQPQLLVQSSRWVQPVTHHYMLAWFDHHLRDLPDARQRLLTDTFDDTADRTAIGVGRWNPVDGNVPYQIADDAVADHLSERFPNWIHLDGETTDLR